MKTFLIPLLAFFATTASLHAEVPENTYRVPVTDNLKAWGTFVIPDAELRIRKDGRLHLEYTMRAALVGERNFKIEAKGRYEGPSKPLKLTGTFGEFECKLVGRKANCRATYNRKTLPVLAPKGTDPVKQYLKANIANEGELVARAAVLDAFSHEAGGTFENLRVRIDRRD